MAIISRRASNAANAIRGVEGSIDIDLIGGGGHNNHSNNSHGHQRRRGDREASHNNNNNNNSSRDIQGPASAIAAAAAIPALSTSATLSSMLRRRRSGDVVGGNGVQGSNGPVATALTANRRTVVGGNAIPAPGTIITGGQNGGGLVKIRLVPHLENQRSLRFEAIARELKNGDPPLRIGRFTDRHNSTANVNRLAFKSKVVSRGHAEVWLEAGKVCYFTFGANIF